MKSQFRAQKWGSGRSSGIGHIKRSNKPHKTSVTTLMKLLVPLVRTCDRQLGWARKVTAVRVPSSPAKFIAPATEIAGKECKTDVT